MVKSTRSKAEAQFTATQKKAKEALKEKDTELRLKAEHKARLKALRLAKEAAEAAGGPNATPHLPQVHRQQS